MGAPLRLGAAYRQARACGTRGGAVARAGGGGGGDRVRILPRILKDEEEEDRRIDLAVPIADPGPEPQRAAVGARWVLLVAVAAVVPRLIYLFNFADPENAGDPFTDAYHHWQIAFLTKE